MEFVGFFSRTKIAPKGRERCSIFFSVRGLIGRVPTMLARLPRPTCSRHVIFFSSAHKKKQEEFDWSIGGSVGGCEQPRRGLDLRRHSPHLAAKGHSHGDAKKTMLVRAKNIGATVFLDDCVLVRTDKNPTT